MRHALIISVAGHAAIVACGVVVFARPALFESIPVESITVDLVSPNEAAASSEEQVPTDGRSTALASDPASSGSESSQSVTNSGSQSQSSQVSQSGSATEPDQPKAKEFSYLHRAFHLVASFLSRDKNRPLISKSRSIQPALRSKEHQ